MVHALHARASGTHHSLMHICFALFMQSPGPRLHGSFRVVAGEKVGEHVHCPEACSCPSQCLDGGCIRIFPCQHLHAENVIASVSRGECFLIV
eukprot:17065-Amphidinium_carterae.3